MSQSPNHQPDQLGQDRHHLARQLRTLSWFGLFYIIMEGSLGVFIGITSGSVALLGFGLDSAIEALASATIIWRFAHHRVLSDHAEQRAQKIVAIQFFIRE